MKKKTVIKIVLDAVMLVALALMYSKNALGMAFHEIGGLALIGVFVIHKALNFSWIRAVSGHLFSRGLRGRARLLYAVDALLFVCFVLIGVSGALMSKVVFSFDAGGMMWKKIHYGCAALALTLVGIHVGLHAAYIGNALRRFALPRIVAWTLVLVVFAFGCVNIVSTNYITWLSMPFRTVEARGEKTNARAENVGAQTTQREERPREGGEREISPLNAVYVFAQYASIAFAFAAATRWVELGLRRRGSTPPDLPA